MATPEVNAGMQWKVLDPTNPSYQVVPPNTWYTVRYNYALADPGSGWLDLADGVFRPTAAHNPAVMRAFVHFADPGPDVRVICTRMRICRDPHGEYGEPDTTGTTEWAGTPGTITNGGYSWHFKIRPLEPPGLQVLVLAERIEQLEVQTSGSPRLMPFPVSPPELVPLTITAAEFKLVVWT